jgi:hypothetical protein
MELSKLRENGVLTEAEFAQLKASIDAAAQGGTVSSGSEG